MAKLLLHSCCAPCALPLIEYLKNNTNYEIIIFYSNSNIFPLEEYNKRLNALKKVSKIYSLILIEDEYDHSKWLKYLMQNLPLPLASYKENENRCLKCFEFRILRTIEKAKELKIDSFATTLSVNRFKDTQYINEFALKIAKQNNLSYYQFDLDPFKSHQRSRELVKQYNIYSQKYCGCEFSFNEVKFK
ncbi:MAG: epoxyqueuosine reductase QueH [Minisyncoccia bacterium]